MASTSVTRTLYDDWRDRRDRLRASGTESADAVLHLRVLNYLLDRYRDVAASLEPAAPLLDAVLVNHRAIVLNHHFGQGQVAGVKNRREADGRMARIIQRMQDRDRADEEEEFLSGPTPHVIRPEVSYYVTSHWAEIDRRRGPLRRETAKRMLAKYPFLPERFI